MRYLVHDGLINGDKYYSNTVSTSLITERHTNTYKTGYEFIIIPNSIIGADSKDISADNYAREGSSQNGYYKVPLKLPQQVEAETIEKVNAEKSKVTRPTQTKYLGFSFWKSKDK